MKPINARLWGYHLAAEGVDCARVLQDSGDFRPIDASWLGKEIEAELAHDIWGTEAAYDLGYRYAREEWEQKGYDEGYEAALECLVDS